MKRTILASLMVSVLALAGSDGADWVKSGDNMYAGVSGNVGIGVEEPKAKLHVLGGARFDSVSVGVGLDAPEGKLHVSGTAVFDLGRGRKITVGTPGGWPGLMALSPNGHRRDICIQDKGIVIAASRSERPSPNENGIWIAEDGNVGIGTTGPEAKLDVNGSILHRGQSLHADYVFEPGYELESIDEHSQFMWQRRHLKAIPKVSVAGDGQEVVEVGAHLKGTVEELEKAHIYIEQLHKRIRTLEEKDAKIVALQQRLTELESLVAGLTSVPGADQ